MNTPQHADDFCYISASKVFLLSIATVGLYLIYWYEVQYAKSKRLPRSAFKDFLKAYFFPFCAFNLSNKIRQLLVTPASSIVFYPMHILVAKFCIALLLESLCYILYSTHVFLPVLLLLEAGYATKLQITINQHLPIRDRLLYPWQHFEWFHALVVIGGILSTSVLFIRLAKS